MSHPPFHRIPALAKSRQLRHGFFTREGGVSGGIYKSLNCGFGSDDTPALVQTNRERVVAALGLKTATLVTPYQVHSARAVVVDEAWAPEQAPEADALVTTRPGLALGVLSADCVPILLADPSAKVIAAAHAGWKGAKGGVLEAAVEAMLGLGAKRARIAAGIGPAIRQRSYEVGPEYREQFAGAEKFFIPSPRPGYWLFDLPGYVAARLRAEGLRAVEDVGLDTVSEAASLFSYRRGTLAGERRYGRMLSVIALA